MGRIAASSITLSVMLCMVGSAGLGQQLTPALEGLLPSRTGTYTVDQVVIPRYRDGANYPAGSILPGIYFATAATAQQKVPAVIISQDVDQAIAQWQGGSTAQDLLPAILGINVRDIIIDGSKVVTDPSKLTSYPTFDGIRLKGNGIRVRNLSCVRVPGTGATFIRVVNPRKGQLRTFDSSRTLIEDIETHFTIRGIYMGAVDGELNNAHAQAFNEYGILFRSTIQSSNLHAYGGRSSDSIGIWFQGDHNHSARLYSENVHIGIELSGNHNVLSQVHTHSCWKTDILVNGRRNIISEAKIKTNRVGFHIGPRAQYNSLFNSDIRSSADEVTLVRLDNGQGIDIVSTRFSMQKEHAKSNAIVVNGTLNQCRIDVQIVGGAVGLNLVGPRGESRLGARNHIRILTTGTAEPIRLPKRWNTSNVIEVNGVRLETP